MMSSILDGRGRGYRAGVTPRRQLETIAVTESRIADISKSGYSFLVATDFVSLTTTGSFNGLLYIKNNSTDRNIFIKTVRVCSSGTGYMQIRAIRNPSAGTLISDANSADKLSANAGSNVVFDGLAYSASGDGKTVTDGDNWTQFINKSPGHSVQDYQGAIVIPGGKSVAITAKPSVATTICIEIQLWFEGGE
jgi:hypothetical protein